MSKFIIISKITVFNDCLKIISSTVITFNTIYTKKLLISVMRSFLLMMEVMIEQFKLKMISAKDKRCDY